MEKNRKRSLCRDFVIRPCVAGGGCPVGGKRRRVDVGCSRARSGTRTVPANTSAPDRVSMSTATGVRKKPHQPRTSSPRRSRRPSAGFPHPAAGHRTTALGHRLLSTAATRYRHRGKRSMYTGTPLFTYMSRYLQTSSVASSATERDRSLLYRRPRRVYHRRRGQRPIFSLRRRWPFPSAPENPFTRLFLSRAHTTCVVHDTTAAAAFFFRFSLPCCSTYNNALLSFSYCLLFAPTADHHRRRQIVTCKRHPTVTRVYDYIIKPLY